MCLILTLTLDQLSVNLSTNLNASQSQVVQPNLVVQSAQVPASDTQGVQFTSLTGSDVSVVSGTSGSFVANRIQLNTNTSEVGVENGFRADALIYVRFPAEAASRRQEPSGVSLGFVLYQNDRFFRSSLYRSRHATVRVLSATVGGRERSVVPQHVEIQFRPTVRKQLRFIFNMDVKQSFLTEEPPNGTSLYDFACAFWDYSKEDWSTVGCSKGNASDGVLRCFCNHTTNFAALWSFREDYKYAEALDWISLVGLSVSVLGLVVTIIYHIKDKLKYKNITTSFSKYYDFFLENTKIQNVTLFLKVFLFSFQKKSRQNNKNSKMALLCIYVSLLAFIITFLSGVQNSHRQDVGEVQTQTNAILDSDEHVEPDGGSCTAVVALLHFFLLATFMWNSVYATQLVLLVRTMHRSLPPHWTPLSVAVGWGMRRVPAVVMAITLGATYRVDNPLGYRQEEFCWLAGLDRDKHFDFGKPMFWGFILPVGLILIYNTVLLVLTCVSICRTDPRLASTSQSLGKKFLTSFSLAVILGVSWSLGYLVLVSSEETHFAFSIIFCLFTTTQGLQIFVLFTARKPSFRATVSRSVQYIASVNDMLHMTTYSLQRVWTGGSESESESYRDLRDDCTAGSKTPKVSSPEVQDEDLKIDMGQRRISILLTAPTETQT
ncbi:adhesion G-protein coupled receptor G7-like [Seriola aureovittata]|uniref:adhesion G-protein coupled receptor G7-like n=1 Tax=Seriola aureovittata TaxID=2871759 RepID=UPI0024BDA0DE|nr:adhesion G-protein coupled receptor G7-like [Seriola aureovittata]